MSLVWNFQVTKYDTPIKTESTNMEYYDNQDIHISPGKSVYIIIPHLKKLKQKLSNVVHIKNNFQKFNDH